MKFLDARSPSMNTIPCDSSSFQCVESRNDKPSIPKIARSDSFYNPKRSENDSDQSLVRSETRMVRFSRRLVFFVLLCASWLCGAATYVIMRQNEEEHFRTQFNDYAREIIDETQIRANDFFAILDSMSVAITSYTFDKNVTWPYITIPHYERRTTPMEKLGLTLNIWFGPLLKPGSRDDWEKWSVENQRLIRGKTDYGGDKTSSLISGTLRDNLPNGTFDHANADAEAWSLPIWQSTPFDPTQINLNVFNFKAFQGAFKTMQTSRSVVLSAFNNYGQDNVNIANTTSWPQSHLISPIFDDFTDKSDIVGVMGATVQWHRFFANVIPEAAEAGLIVVVENTCDQVVTYKIAGSNVIFLGEGDLHDSEFDFLEVSADFMSSLVEVDGNCAFNTRAYPCQEFRESLSTNEPLIYTVAVVLIFMFTSAVFLVYDCFVKKRQKKVMTSALNSNAIVTSLFPAQVRDRLMADNIQAAKDNELSAMARAERRLSFTTATRSLSQRAGDLNTKPIADLFPNVTVMFADICGFTAWSSVRDPPQVFMLLEKIYNSFDVIAKRWRVFKVETIGDCYVAAAGLPEPRKDHAEVMAKFAEQCRSKVNQVVKRLEVTLGPDTGELSMRFGLHSGPVTAGVLRGEKSRFQLFGDTVNTTSRIESTGARNMIHVSQETASLLVAAGKSDWVRPRETLVAAKGKGMMQTYWLTMSGSHEEKHNSGSQSETETRFGDRSSLNDKANRLIEWNVDVLHRQLKKIVAMRDSKKKKLAKQAGSLFITHQEGKTVLDEVKEIISLPSEASEYLEHPEKIQLSPGVTSQLRDYVTTIASMYRDNAFHSFDHASHVTQSVTKLLTRVVTPNSIDYNDMSYKRLDREADLHEYTYGITSDPLTQFACIFSALIHDLDHTGVPNSQLVAEKADIARVYKNKSVAEQNSVDLAWKLLMEPSYSELRESIYANEEELERFRELVVNSVMATDIVDKELGALRKKRWEEAFTMDSDENISPELSKEISNRKATIVIEHLIQASDVAHTMQHWHIYQKWNQKLFNEMYKAFLAGRAIKDPSETWYKGEIGFYDFYVIPLAKKLKECGVFGVASDEYLNYAIANRQEWVKKGRGLVAAYLSDYKKVNGVVDA